MQQINTFPDQVDIPIAGNLDAYCETRSVTITL